MDEMRYQCHVCGKIDSELDNFSFLSADHSGDNLPPGTVKVNSFFCRYNEDCHIEAYNTIRGVHG